MPSEEEDPFFGELVRTLELEMPSPLSLHCVAGQKLAMIMGWTTESNRNGPSGQKRTDSCPATDAMFHRCMRSICPTLFELLQHSPSLPLADVSSLLQKALTQLQQSLAAAPPSPLEAPCDTSSPPVGAALGYARRVVAQLLPDGLQLAANAATIRLLAETAAVDSAMVFQLTAAPDAPLDNREKMQLLMVHLRLESNEAVCSSTGAGGISGSTKRRFSELTCSPLHLLHVRCVPSLSSVDDSQPSVAHMEAGTASDDKCSALWMTALHELDSRTRAVCAQQPAEGTVSPMLLLHLRPCLLVLQVSGEDRVSDIASFLSSLRASGALWRLPYVHLSLLLGRLVVLSPSASFSAPSLVPPSPSQLHAQGDATRLSLDDRMDVLVTLMQRDRSGNHASVDSSDSHSLPLSNRSKRSKAVHVGNTAHSPPTSVGE
jgi:hypothetical protein